MREVGKNYLNKLDSDEKSRFFRVLTKKSGKKVGIYCISIKGNIAKKGRDMILLGFLLYSFSFYNAKFRKKTTSNNLRGIQRFSKGVKSFEFILLN